MILCMSAFYLENLKFSLPHPTYDPNGILSLFFPNPYSSLFTKCLTLTFYCSINALWARIGHMAQWLYYRLRHQIARN